MSWTGWWKEQLQQNGLRIRHHLQWKTTLDHPRVIGGIEEDDNYYCIVGDQTPIAQDYELAKKENGLLVSVKKQAREIREGKRS